MLDHIFPAGHCQCCGRKIRLIEGDSIGWHGALSEQTLKYQGTCPGYGLKAMEVDRSKTDETIQDIEDRMKDLERIMAVYEQSGAHIASMGKQFHAPAWDKIAEEDRIEILSDEALHVRVRINLLKDKIHFLRTLADNVYPTQLA